MRPVILVNKIPEGNRVGGLGGKLRSTGTAVDAKHSFARIAEAVSVPQICLHIGVEIAPLDIVYYCICQRQFVHKA
jgi:hypothetical protein